MDTWHRFRQWLANGFDIISMSIKALSGDPSAWESTIQKAVWTAAIKPILLADLKTA